MALSAGCRVIVPDVEIHEAFARTADLEALRRVGIRAGQSTPLVVRSGRLLAPTGHDFNPLAKAASPHRT
jgi:hypothetical protein